MCGISDRAWRILAREQGCSFVFTQMVSSEALLHEHQKSWRLLDLEGEEGPVGVQLFGCKPQDLGVAARMLQDAGAALVDLNIGCPARKIVKVRGGSALLREPEVVREILHEMRAALSIPLTIKIRAGWEQYGPEAFLITEIAEGEGVDAITIHARTRAQGFKGQADWSIIAELKRRTRLPVIGNGDIRSGADGVRMMRETGCDGVMVGRGIIGNPWLIGDLCRSIRHTDLAAGAETGTEAGGADQAPGQPAAPAADQTAPQTDGLAAPSLPERIEMMRRHARLMARTPGHPARAY